MKIPRICTIRQFLKIGKHEGGPLSVQFILNLSSVNMKMNKMIYQNIHRVQKLSPIYYCAIR